MRLIKISIRVIICLFVFLFFIGFLSYYYLFPIGDGKQHVELIIPPGASASTVADSLKKHKVITSTTALRLWMKVTGSARKIQAGKVICNVGDGVINISKKLQHAQSIEIAFTIAEGLTVEQTASRILKAILIDTTEFTKLCYDTAFLRELGIKEHSLEGYLFPDTYRFPENVQVKEIIRKMISHFEEVYRSLQADSQIISKYTKHQIVTIASIVEKEATVPWERPRIAGVFHNRLKIGYPLGADPTVRFALKKFNGPLRVSELNSSSPYNTRRFSGLPPGPICSPGKASMQAAIAPEDTKDLYFVAKWDGSGEHDFSKTNEEHTKKKLLIRHQNELRKKELGPP